MPGYMDYSYCQGESEWSSQFLKASDWNLSYQQANWIWRKLIRSARILGIGFKTTAIFSYWKNWVRWDRRPWISISDFWGNEYAGEYSCELFPAGGSEGIWSQPWAGRDSGNPHWQRGWTLVLSVSGEPWLPLFRRRKITQVAGH